MAFGDSYVYWPTATTTLFGYGSPCNHGTPYGSPCFYCQHPAIGLAPQTFRFGGWQCVCGRGFAPSVTECPYCPQQKPAGESAGFDAEPVSDLCVTQEPGTGSGLRHAPPGVTTACPCSTEGGLCGCEEGDGDGTCTSFDCSC